jgi:hypothetical protein
MCEAHHLIHWIDDGPTAIWNLVLLCKAHHIDLHNGHWTITITNGRVNVTRPTWATPGPTHRLSRRPPPDTTATERPRTPSAATATDHPAAPPNPARAWPHTADIPWITPDEAARLNPWGDEPHQPPRTPPRPTTATTWVDPWADDPDTGSPGP